MICTCENDTGRVGACHGGVLVDNGRCETCGKLLMSACECDECGACGHLIAKGTGILDAETEGRFCDDDCLSNYGERMQERMLSDYYGGSASFNDRERVDVEGRGR